MIHLPLFGSSCLTVVTNPSSPRYLSRCVRNAALARRSENKWKQNNENDLVLVQQSSVVEQEPEADYLGIAPNKDASFLHGQYGIDGQSQQSLHEQVITKRSLIENKYQSLLRPSMDSKMKQTKTWFGQIRLDSLNQPRFHGQYEKQNGVNSVKCSLEQNPKTMQDTSVKVDSSKSCEPAQFQPKTFIFDDSDCVDERVTADASIRHSSQSIISSKINFKYTGLVEPKQNKRVDRSKKSNDWISHKQKQFENSPVLGFSQSEGDERNDNFETISDSMAKVKYEFKSKFEKLPESKVMTGSSYLR